MQGILFTVNHLKAKAAMQEIKNLMGQYLSALGTADNVASPTEEAQPAPEARTTATPVASDSVSSRLGAELAAMKQAGPGEGRAKYAGVRVLEAPVGGYFFVATAEDPRELVLRISKDFCSSRQSSTRFLYRLIPIQKVCRSHVPTIKAAAAEVWQRYAAVVQGRSTASEPTAEKIRYMISTKARSHTGLEGASNELKRDIAAAVTGDAFAVHLQAPDVVLFVYTLQSVTLIGVGEDVARLREFNVHELATKGPLTEAELAAKRVRKAASPVAAAAAANSQLGSAEGTARAEKPADVATPTPSPEGPEAPRAEEAAEDLDPTPAAAEATDTAGAGPSSEAVAPPAAGPPTPAGDGAPAAPEPEGEALPAQT
eukprot:EG_transcript_8989